MKRATASFDKQSWMLSIGVRHNINDLCWCAIIVVGPFSFQYRLWASK